ncbi:MAG TPA: cation:proton antiporter [Kiritimatiellia bacterium]|nr:cation:proton antiporter [Kiritimatiellia bacterium]MBP9572704.1 cation:proton antiporter [Kiritimatiellia bacterium]HQF21007.1 cation:proton antiporter [Kiritimatiellia bacterium]HQG75027.1 cation:proton antiporter [Kiritimatiellia bacterium]HXK79782.1 cation:proton antiporter [Kiritimatiellia bacterium]
MFSSELKFIVQLGILIVFTRIGGHWLRRWLRLPGVLGELIVGMLIGPYALGKISWPWVGAMFPPLTGAMPISTELYAVATFASIVLLFLSGLETDLSTFLRYSVAGTIVGIGGVVFSFLLGAGCALWFGLADSWLDPHALFLGAVGTATSVGITARILSEHRKMDSAEGVTVMAAAVFDDVLGVIILAIVVGTVRAETSGGPSWQHILWTAGKAFGFWIVATVAGLLLARRFSRILKYFKTTQAISALALGCALLVAGLSEMAGLAMIIGAYIMGLSLSRTDLVQVIQREIEGLHNILVPVFFATMGMLVNFAAVVPVFKIGLIYSLLAVISKVAGCGLPALFCGFNRHGAIRIGTGMLPRGEVALIVAGIGLTSGAIGQDIFGIAILMTVITTVLGPLFLSASFENPAPGLRHPEDTTKTVAPPIVLPFPSADMADFMVSRIVTAFRNEEFYVYRLTPEEPTYHIRKDDIFFILSRDGQEVRLTTSQRHATMARLLVAEEMLTLRSMLHMATEDGDYASFEQNFVATLFQDSTPPPAE